MLLDNIIAFKTQIELLKELNKELQDRVTDLTIIKRDLELKIGELQKENKQLQGNLKSSEILYDNLRQEKKICD